MTYLKFYLSERGMTLRELARLPDALRQAVRGPRRAEVGLGDSDARSREYAAE